MAVTTAALKSRLSSGSVPLTDTPESSNVRAFGFDRDRRVLYVRFKGGRLYAYPQTTPQRARSMANAASKGRFVWNALRNYGADTKPYRRLA